MDFSFNKVRKVQDLDELAEIVFPDNRNLQKVFLAIFVELKWSECQFLPMIEPIADKHGISRRTLETVRAKMRRLGLIDHVSRFNKQHGYREGWVFSTRFTNSLRSLPDTYGALVERRGGLQEEKDRNLIGYFD